MTDIHTLDQVDSLMSELGLADSLLSELGLAPAPTKSSGPGVSMGPGISSGPGVSSGPGAAWASSGPGAARVSSGPGAGFVSSGPGGGWAGDKAAARPISKIDGDKKLAEKTPDGREITWNGPPCHSCGGQILGQVTNALDRTYHPEHFVCHSCNKAFPGGNFIEHESEAYCQTCYTDLLAPKCHNCGLPITSRCISALGSKFHPEHFSCAGCGTSLGGQQYKEWEGEPFCVKCHSAKRTPKYANAGICAFCKRQIQGEFITLNGQRVHPEHYRCEECGAEFTGGNCHEYEGKLYCYDDYLKLLRSTCAYCHKPIMGRTLTAMGKIWHPEHFMCFTCKEPFAGSEFFEHGGNAYCDTHFHQLFGEMCASCNKLIEGPHINYEGRVYHPHHFLCNGCDKPLDKEKPYAYEGTPLCGNCYKKLPKDIRKRLEAKKKAERKARSKVDKTMNQ